MHALLGVAVGSLLVALYGGLSLTLTHVQVANAVVDAEIYDFRIEIQCSPIQIDRALPIGSLLSSPSVVFELLKIRHVGI